jgi:hypothetical protein
MDSLARVGEALMDPGTPGGMRRPTATSSTTQGAHP